MMPDKNELIKEYILKELGHLSYLEKKNLTPELNSEFITRESEKVSKQLRFHKFFSIFWAILTLAHLTLFILDVSRGIEAEWLIIKPIILLGYIILTILFFYNFGITKKKQSLLRILSILAGNE